MFFYDSPIAARLFDLQHEGDTELEREKKLLLEEIAAASGPALELGCGTGRILLPALERGLDVLGCDRSAPFLERLVEEAERRGLTVGDRVWLGDIEDQSLAEKFQGFALAFAAFRTFDHLVEEGARERFLKVARRLLGPRGRMLLNLSNPDPTDLDGMVGQKFLMRDDLEDPDSGRRVLWWGTSWFERERNLIRQIFDYDFVNAEGRVEESYSFPFTLRWTPHEEMSRLVEKAGFEVAACWGGFGREPFETGTGDAVWDLRKK